MGTIFRTGTLPKRRLACKGIKPLKIGLLQVILTLVQPISSSKPEMNADISFNSQ
jgi:hypothetical protein